VVGLKDLPQVSTGHIQWALIGLQNPPQVHIREEMRREGPRQLTPGQKHTDANLVIGLKDPSQRAQTVGIVRTKKSTSGSYQGGNETRGTKTAHTRTQTFT
jgi:hypothetical protein